MEHSTEKQEHGKVQVRKLNHTDATALTSLFAFGCTDSPVSVRLSVAQ